MAYYAFAVATGIIAVVATLLFFLRADKVIKMKDKRDRPMLVYLAVAVVSLFAFAALFGGITDPEIALSTDVGMLVLFFSAMFYEVYLVHRSGSPAKSQQN